MLELDFILKKHLATNILDTKLKFNSNLIYIYIFINNLDLLLNFYFNIYYFIIDIDKKIK